jgi:hypothetical protein
LDTIANLLGPSGNSEGIKHPLELSLSIAAGVVIAEKYLAAKDRGRKPSANVVEAAVPDVLVHVETRLEPIVEWFDSLTAPTE